jgi:hypothetical protein
MLAGARSSHGSEHTGEEGGPLLIKFISYKDV